MRNSISYKRRKDLESPGIESIWVELTNSNHKLLLCVLYRANSNTDIGFWDSLQTNIDLVLSTCNSKVMLVGDFNADFSTVQGTYLCNLCEASNLTLHVQEPTRITPFSRSTLDQIISSSPTFVSDVKVNPPIANCDHCVISAICNFKVVKQQPYKRLMWQFSDTNFERFRDSLTQVDWNISTGDINRSTLNFTEKSLEVAKATKPNKVVMIRSTDKPWYNSYLRRIKRKVLRL